jgi:hypothetical protein
MNITHLEDKKELIQFKDREGFVVQFKPSSKIRVSDDIDASLIKAGVVNVNPEFVYSMPGEILVFIYPENVRLDMKLFYSFAEPKVTNFPWAVDGLGKFIKENVK